MANASNITLGVIKKSAFILPVLLAALFIELSVTLPHAKTTPTEVYYGQPSLLWGDVYAVTIKTHSTGETPKGTFFGKELKFFKTSEGEYSTLVSVPAETPSGIQPLKISESLGNKTVESYHPLVVSKKNFKTTSFTVPKNMATPGKKALERIKRERELAWRIIDERTNGLKAENKLWDEAFKLPVTSKVTDPFGTKRTVNKVLRYSHNGLDMRAKTGTRIRAANSGEVVIARDFYLTGYTVILDHGLGLFTTYAHLSKLKVKEGEKIRRGQVLGLAGATGRVTGPHLHFGVVLNEQYVNPLSLIRATGAIERRNVKNTPATVE